MILKELIEILNFKEKEKNFRYCFYVENNNIFNYLKKHIYKKSIKFKILIFSKEKIFYEKNSNIINLIIKNKFLNYFFFKNLNIKFIYTSTPDLNNSYFVKSKNNCKYIYIQHSPVSLIMAYNSTAFNHFDAVQAINTYQYNEINLINNKYNLNIKSFKSKYSFLELTKKIKIQKKKLLIAPTWNTDFYKNNIHIKLFDLLNKNKINFEFRPHFMSIKKKEINLKEFKNINFNLDYYVDLSEYNNLITDWSGIFLEFAIINKRKPILIETKKKVNNKNYLYENNITVEEKYRKLIGKTINQDNLGECINLIDFFDKNEIKLIDEFLDEIFY